MDKTQFVLAIVANIATIIIVFFAKRSFSLGKRLVTTGITKAKVRYPFSAKMIGPFIKYIAFVFIGIIPIGYNSWWLYGFTRGSTAATRSDVLVILFFAGTIVYWLLNIVSKFKNYSVADYIRDA